MKKITICQGCGEIKFCERHTRPIDGLSHYMLCDECAKKFGIEEALNSETIAHDNKT